MAKNNFLMKQLFRSGTSHKRNAEPMKQQDCPKLTSIMLILVLAMLAGIFVVKMLT